jgi:hypothetical protein
MSDLISREATLKHLEKRRQDALMMDDLHSASIIMNGMALGEEAVRNQPSVQPEKRTETHACDLISRQAAIDAIFSEPLYKTGMKKRDANEVVPAIFEKIKTLPSAQPEPLTDKEQRIFLAAMGREEKVCKQVDDECRDCREPYEDSLVRTCHEIVRKVKGALWT